MNKVIVSKIGLSNNPQAQVNNSLTANISKDGREYVMVTYSEEMGPDFGPNDKLRSKQRIYIQDAKGNWPNNVTPEQATKLYTGKRIAGEFIMKNVVPYEVDGRSVSTYTTLVFPKENAITVFKNEGHPVVDTTTGEVITTGNVIAEIMSAK